jgi:hypothetical protein
LIQETKRQAIAKDAREALKAEAHPPSLLSQEQFRSVAAGNEKVCFMSKRYEKLHYL